MAMVLHSMALTTAGSTQASAMSEPPDLQSACRTPLMLPPSTLLGQFHRRQPDSKCLLRRVLHRVLQHNRLLLTNRGPTPHLSRSPLHLPLLNRSPLKDSQALPSQVLPSKSQPSQLLLNRNHQPNQMHHSKVLLKVVLSNLQPNPAATALLLRAVPHKAALLREVLLKDDQLQAAHSHNQVLEESLQLVPTLLLAVLPNLLVVLLLQVVLLLVDLKEVLPVVLLLTSPNLPLVDLLRVDNLPTGQSLLLVDLLPTDPSLLLADLPLAQALVALLPKEDQLLPLQVRLEKVLIRLDLDPHPLDLHPEPQASLKALQTPLQARDYFG